MQGRDGQGVANAAAEVSLEVKRSEDATMLAKVWGKRRVRRRLIVEGGKNRPVSNPQQQPTLFE
jgi:ribosomal protein L44E